MGTHGREIHAWSIFGHPMRITGNWGEQQGRWRRDRVFEDGLDRYWVGRRPVLHLKGFRSGVFSISFTVLYQGDFSSSNTRATHLKRDGVVGIDAGID